MGNAKKVGFFVVTGLFALAIVPGAIMNLVQPDMVVELMQKIDVPIHLLTLMGIWKLLGLIALAAPGMAKIKQFAYAGFFFDLTGAAYLHAAGGDLPGIVPPLFLAALLIASYVLRVDPGASFIPGVSGLMARRKAASATVSRAG